MIRILCNYLARARARAARDHHEAIAALIAAVRVSPPTA